jgi:hypothetical protein
MPGVWVYRPVSRVAPSICGCGCFCVGVGVGVGVCVSVPVSVSVLVSVMPRAVASLPSHMLLCPLSHPFRPPFGLTFPSCAWVHGVQGDSDASPKILLQVHTHQNPHCVCVSACVCRPCHSYTTRGSFTNCSRLRLSLCWCSCACVCACPLWAASRSLSRARARLLCPFLCVQALLEQAATKGSVLKAGAISQHITDISPFRHAI